jgi:hypothetical protein
MSILFFPVRLCALSAALSLLAGAAMAQTEKTPPRDKDRGTAAAARAAPVVAVAPNARLAALIKRGGALLRNKGVESVTIQDVGVYCIKPAAATGIDPATAIVMLTVEYFNSSFNEVKVQWATMGSGCGAGRIGVYTLADANADGIYTFSNQVGFSIVVP